MFLKAKAAFAALMALAGVARSADVHSQADLTRAVENPSLVKAMDRLASEKTNAAQDHLLGELQHARFLAGMLPANPNSRLPLGKGQHTVPAGSRFGVLSAGQGGQMYMMLFTDWHALHAFTNQKVTGWVLPAKDAWQFALQNKDFAGVVINPAHNALPLPRPMLEYLARQASKPR